MNVASIWMSWLSSVAVGKVGGSPIDFHETPALGVQLDLSLVDTVTLELGYLTGASGFNGNRAWGQFFDLILTGAIERFTLILNANATLDPPASGGQYSYGVTLSGEMMVHEHFRVGARVEEPRFEHSPQEFSFTRSSPTDPATGSPIADSNIYFGFVLGVSAYIGN
jgi:hypothetical protein